MKKEQKPKIEPTPGTVLVINQIHDEKKRAYRFETTEVSEETARIQLSKQEGERNHYWKGVRYATKEEYNEFYGQEDEKPVENKKPELATQIKAEEKQTILTTQENIPTQENKTRGRKPKPQTV
jgi:hypothetical protein